MKETMTQINNASSGATKAMAKTLLIGFLCFGVGGGSEAGCGAGLGTIAFDADDPELHVGAPV